MPRPFEKSFHTLAMSMILATAIFAPFSAGAADRTLIVVGDSDCAPYSYLDENGQALGFESDLIREIASKKGFIVEFHLKPWNLSLRDLCLKKADILLGAVMSSPFAGVIDYTIPHSYDQYTIFAKSSFKYRNLGELAVYDTALQRADPVYDILLAPSGAVRNKTWTDTSSAAFKELGEGRCGYVVAPYSIGMDALERLKFAGISAIGEPLAPCVRRFAVRKGSPELLALLNEGIDSVKASPKFDQLRAKWFKNERKAFDRNTAFRYGLYIFIPLVIALDGLLIWSLILKRQVRRRSRDLQESRGNYKLLFEGVSDGILVSDEKGKVIEFNAGASKLFSAEGASLAGKTLKDIFGESSKDLAQNKSKSVECSVKKPNGDELFLEVSGGDALLGRRKFTVTIARDISERKLAESLMADVERMTRHDLKGPLNGILAVPELIRLHGDLNSEQSELLKLVEDSGWTMLGMINLSQDMYKIEKGVYELRPVSVNLSPLIKRLLVEAHPLVGARRITVEVTYDGKPWKEISPLRISGEELLCHSLFSNLLKNAMEASPEGGVVQIALGKGEDFNTVAIKNRGAVPREMRDKFFDKYASSGKKGGTGLGTYNAMLIAKLHCGDIKMETSEQDGTTITVFLPAAKEL